MNRLFALALVLALAAICCGQKQYGCSPAACETDNCCLKSLAPIRLCDPSDTSKGMQGPSGKCMLTGTGDCVEKYLTCEKGARS